jgi:hypothetical protein
MQHIHNRQCAAGVCEMTEVPLVDLAEELPRRLRAGRAEAAQEVSS